MEPDREIPELDGMPPIDDELREAMEDMARRLERFDRVQKLLALLSAVCFWNVVGVGSLFANVIVATFWGNRLSNKGWKLVIQAYPWLHNIPFLCGPTGGKHYNGITAGQRIREEAKKTGDRLTLRLMGLASSWRQIGWCFAGVLGYLAALVLFGRLVTWK